MRYLSHVIGVPEDSPSLRFRGALMEDGRTIFIDLTKYEEINSAKDAESDLS